VRGGEHRDDAAGGQRGREVVEVAQRLGDLRRFAAAGLGQAPGETLRRRRAADRIEDPATGRAS
jgi:hypothetical protein